MNYLSAETISKSFNERWLFKDVTIGINSGQKVALVGVNGSGKSTLLNVLAGKINSDSGKVVMRKDIRVGYLDQDPQFDGATTVFNALFSSENQVLTAIKEYEDALQHPENKGLQEAMEKMDLLKAWDYEQKVKQIITKLGLPELEQLISNLSGGQKKRVAMARVLIEEPELLIMDEPTNHLDLESIEWLETLLSSQQITLLLVTHDRYFLDRVATEIIELDNGVIYPYKGNYSYFLEKKADRELREMAEVDKAKNLMRKELEWMRRQPKARGTKSKARIDAFYDLKEKATSKKDTQKLELDIKTTRQGGKVIETAHVKKVFGDKKIINDFSYIFKKKERIGVIGRNGTGKSTFLNILAGLMQPDSGKIDKGETTVIGYYTQKGLVITEDQRVLEVVKDIAEVITLSNGQTMNASQFLQYFLFPPAMQHTFVSKLSGGERKRLQLLKILITNPNFLILDEPTNDFDLATLNVLEDFLMNFAGCLLVVSHDRYFMDKLVDHLFIFEGEGEIRDFPGNYTDWRELKEEEDELKEQLKKQPAAKKEEPKPANTSEKKKLSFQEKKEYDTLETEIMELEEKKFLLVEKLNSGSGSHEDITLISKEIAQLISLVENKTIRWLELSERL